MDKRLLGTLWLSENKATIEYISNGQHLLVSCSPTEVKKCCHGDRVSFHLATSSDGFSKAVQVMLSSWKQFLGSVTCVTKEHGIIKIHNSGEKVNFDPANHPVSVGKCVCVTMETGGSVGSITVVPEAGPHLGIVVHVMHQNNKKVTRLVCEIGGALRQFDCETRLTGLTHTLFPGDIVAFYSADKSTIDHVIVHKMVDEFHQSTGVVTGVFPFTIGEAKIPFVLEEVVTMDWTPQIGDCVTYSVLSSNDGVDAAIRVAHVNQPAIKQSDWLKGVVCSTNEICYHDNEGKEMTIACSNLCARIGDHVSFQIWEGAVHNLTIQKSVEIERGLIATLRDGFGFIETEDRQQEVFFSFSGCAAGVNPHSLTLLQEVTYQLQHKDGKVSATAVQPIPIGSIEREQIDDTTALEGIVLRPMKSTDQPEHYEGVIQVSGDINKCYPYSISSLVDPLVAMQHGDLVQFKVGWLLGQQRAVKVISSIQFIVGVVESLKPKERYGFISYQDNDGMSRSVFFHMSSVDSQEEIAIGNQVTFQLSFSQRAQKHSATHVSCLTTNRPTRLVARNKIQINSHFIVLRQPRGPDANCRGFNQS